MMNLRIVIALLAASNLLTSPLAVAQDCVRPPKSPGIRSYPDVVHYVYLEPSPYWDGDAMSGLHEVLGNWSLRNQASGHGSTFRLEMSLSQLATEA